MRVLFIAYYFPPLGGAGVQRSVKFVKHLPRFGVTPIVLTGSGAEFDRLCPPDPTLSPEIPPSTKILRTGSVRTGSTSQFGEKLRGLSGLPSRRMQVWNSMALSLGADWLARERVDAIYVSASPYPSLKLAESLSRLYSVPWVADLRDPWALDEVQVYKTRWHRALALRRMKASLRTASSIIMNTPEAERRVRHVFPGLSRQVGGSITNGYDEEDFGSSVEPTPNQQFTIVHSGSFHADAGLRQRAQAFQYQILGRTTPGVQILPRSHFYLLAALERWLEEQPDISQLVRVVTAGTMTREDRALVQESRVANMFEFRQYLPHAEAVRLTRTADLLFLPLHKPPHGMRSSIVPGKTYEYLATGRPVLAAVPEGDARDFVTGAGTGLICEPDDVGGMLRILKTQFHAWQAGKQTVTWNRSYVEQFERRSLTRKLAQQLESVSELRTAMPGRTAAFAN